MFKVAFFGSDLFSLASFKALVNLHRTQPNIIGHVSLVTRRLKPSGRGMKTILEPEIVKYAGQENIDWHQIEEVQEFEALQTSANIAVAVSYGRMIPGSLINNLPFGGINVHPSLLPKYRGASPMQYAIMNQDSYTGVSVQTLHPTRFDHGRVVWQSEAIPLQSRETIDSLTGKLAEIGAQGLVETLKSQVSGKEVSVETPYESSRAPILSNALAKIDFELGHKQLDARGRALSKLWFMQKVTQKTLKGKLKGHPELRINLRNFEEVHEVPDGSSEAALGTIVQGKSQDGKILLALKCKDGFLGASEVTVQGFKPESAEHYFTEFQKRKLEEAVVN